MWDLRLAYLWWSPTFFCAALFAFCYLYNCVQQGNGSRDTYYIKVCVYTMLNRYFMQGIKDLDFSLWGLDNGLAYRFTRLRVVSANEHRATFFGLLGFTAMCKGAYNIYLFGC